MVSCDIPESDVIFSAKAIHHVPPTDLPALFARVVGALRPSGCFILYDAMSVGPHWGERVRGLSSRFRQRHIQDVISSGVATQEEIDARRRYKREMKAAGRDVEYGHVAEDLTRTMTEVGFDEVAIVWRMFADTILMAFAPDHEAGVAEQAQ